MLEALFAAEGPVPAGHLARNLSIDVSSVFRNLKVLERHGLIRHGCSAAAPSVTPGVGGSSGLADAAGGLRRVGCSDDLMVGAGGLVEPV